VAHGWNLHQNLIGKTIHPLFSLCVCLPDWSFSIRCEYMS
jgi:hypothetical protein